MMGYDHPWTWWHGGGMWFFPLLVIGGIVLVSFLVSGRSRNQDNGNCAVAETAMDILKKRYAKGELSKEQFDQMKSDLTAES